MSARRQFPMFGPPPSKPFRLVAPIPAEDELHHAVNGALRVLLPTDAVLNTWELRNAASVAEGARRKRLGALPGWPDIGVFWNARVVLLELKRERHGRLSPAQRFVHRRLKATGFTVAVCRSVDDALAAVQAVGIPLRGRIAA